MGQTDIDDAAADAWGVDHEGYFALEGYGAIGGESYLGGEMGQVGVGSTIEDNGERLRDFHLYWGELNGKHAFDLTHGFTFDAGLGSALFYVQGEEVTTLSGGEFTDPLASFGFGAQVFIDFTWRTRHLLLGVDAKYQWAFDFVNIDYSNLRYGGHLGFAF
jgi:hypothetical protein